MVIFHSYVKLLEGIWHEVIGAKTTSHLGLLLLLYSSQRLVLAGCRRKHGRNMTEIDQIKCKRGEPLKKNQVWQYCNVHIRTVSLFKNGRHILKTQHSQFQSDIDQWESPCALMDQAGSGGAPIMHPEAWPDMSGRWPGRWLPSFGGSIHQPFTNHPRIRNAPTNHSPFTSVACLLYSNQRLGLAGKMSRRPLNSSGSEGKTREKNTKCSNNVHVYIYITIRIKMITRITTIIRTIVKLYIIITIII